jgi:hypothetical protein
MKRLTLTGPLAAALIILVFIILLIFLLPLAIIIACMAFIYWLVFLVRKGRKKAEKQKDIIDVEYSVKKE